jgi:hypothetical protein
MSHLGPGTVNEISIEDVFESAVCLNMKHEGRGLGGLQLSPSAS